MVNLLLKYLLMEFKNLDRQGVYGFTQRELSFNSNRIEGSTLTRKQTAFLFETGTLTSDGEIIRAKDIEEMTGHFAMFNEMLKTWDEPLSEDLIKKYHFRLKSGVFEDQLNGYPVGEYKNRANIVSDIKTTLPEFVHDEMEHLLREYASVEKVTLEDLARFHSQFEKIHPFQDGNGRTGRIILFKECLHHAIFPFVIDDKNKVVYYHALNKAQTENDYDDLVDLFKKEQTKYKENISQFIKEI